MVFCFFGFDGGGRTVGIEDECLVKYLICLVRFGGEGVGSFEETSMWSPLRSGLDGGVAVAGEDGAGGNAPLPMVRTMSTLLRGAKCKGEGFCRRRRE